MFNLTNLTIDEALEIALSTKHPLEETYAIEFIKPVFIDPKECIYKFSKIEFLQKLFNKITCDIKKDIEKIKAWTRYLCKRHVHSLYIPLHTRYKKMIFCPVWIILNRMAHCGQINRTLSDGLSSIGYKTRLVQLAGHVASEVFYKGEWLFLDAEYGNGEFILDNENKLCSVEKITRNLHYIIKWNKILYNNSAYPLPTISSSNPSVKFSNINAHSIIGNDAIYYPPMDIIKKIINNKNKFNHLFNTEDTLDYDKNDPVINTYINIVNKYTNFIQENNEIIILPEHVKLLCALFYRNLQRYIEVFIEPSIEENTSVDTLSKVNNIINASPISPKYYVKKYLVENTEHHYLFGWDKYTISKI